MSKIICTNKLQYEVINSDARITVVTAEPGSGSTYALILKAIQACSERKVNCSFFVPTLVTAKVPGGVVDSIRKVVGDFVRYSEKSMIFTFDNESKIKIVPCEDDDFNRTLGLSRELMLFDSNVPDKFIEFHLKRSYEAVIVDSICEIEKEDSWANNLQLLEKDNDKIVGFVDGIKHIKGSLSDNYFFGESGKYRELVVRYVNLKMRTEFQ